MRPLLSATAIQLQRNLLHRAFWLQLLIGRILPIAIPLLAWEALFDYTQAAELQGWSRSAMTSYYFLVFFLSLFADIHFHYEMSTMVHMGTLSQWLMRPLSFLETAASFVLAKVLTLLIPGLIVLLLGFWLSPPFPSGTPLFSFLAAIATVPLSLVMFGLLSAVIGMFSFWIMKTESIFALVMLVLEFFGGRLLPLSLLPKWLEELSYFFPLRFAISLPAEAILHPLQQSVFPIILGQTLWCVFLFLLASLLWREGLKRFDAVGG